jgi:hypothetical protein
MAALGADDNSVVSQAIASAIASSGGGGSAQQATVPLWVTRPKAKMENRGQFDDNTHGQPGRVYVGPRPTDFHSEGYAASYYLDMTDAEREDFKRRALAAGIIQPGRDGVVTNSDVMEAWTKMVSAASSYNAERGDKPAAWISPWEAINKFAGRDLAGADGAVDLFKPVTTTSINHRKIGVGDIQGSLEQIFQAEMGRTPKKGELEAYRRMVQAAYDKNPEKTTQTTTYDPSGNPTVNSTSSGGIDVNSTLLDQVQGTNEADAYQAGVTYMQAIQQAIASPV